MSRLPWDRDYDHDHAAIPRAIEEQFPSLAPVRAEYVSSGWDFDAYRVNGRWVFRFPRRQDCAHSWEPGLLDLVARELEVEVPVVEFRGEPGRHFPYSFFGHRWLEGVGPRAVEPDHEPLAAQFGGVLGGLHPLEAEVPVANWGPEQWIAAVVDSSAWIEAALPARERKRWAAWLRGEVPVPPSYSGPARLCHSDLAEEHLLFDPVTRRLTGVLDWSDTSLGDPVCDFVGLQVWLGEGFVERVLRHYDPDPGPGFLDRLGFAVRTRLLVWAGESHRWDGRDLVPGTAHWVKLLSQTCPQ